MKIMLLFFCFVMSVNSQNYPEDINKCSILDSLFNYGDKKSENIADLLNGPNCPEYLGHYRGGIVVSSRLISDCEMRRQAATFLSTAFNVANERPYNKYISFLESEPKLAAQLIKEFLNIRWYNGRGHEKYGILENLPKSVQNEIVFMASSDFLNRQTWSEFSSLNTWVRFLVDHPKRDSITSLLAS